MGIINLVQKEIFFRKFSFSVALLSVTIAVSTLTGAYTLLKIHDIRTTQILAVKESETARIMDQLKDEMRVAMLKLGLNLVILPKAQNAGDWYMKDSSEHYMPEEYVGKLANSGVITVRHFLPTLSQKVKWREQNRRIILTGTKGEVPNLHKSPKRPIVQPVPDGTVVLGWELHQSIGVKEGDQVTLLGKKYIINRCHEERGNKDDVTAWIPLKDAQEMLGKPGLINAILALQCTCKSTNLSKVRGDIAKVLPSTQVLELGTERRLARLEARMAVGTQAKASLEKEKSSRQALGQERERFAAYLVLTVLLASLVWIAFLVLGNVKDRMKEIGTLCALGYQSGSILSLFLLRSLFIAIIGSVLGLVFGLLSGKMAATYIEEGVSGTANLLGLVDPTLVVLVILTGPVMTILASWIPAVIASKKDPAQILQQEAF